MSWQSDYIITLRANNVDDPDETTGRQEVTISCTGAEPILEGVGNPEGDPNGTLYNVIDKRIGAKITCREATVLANLNPDYQDYGVIWHLLNNVLTPPIESDAIEWYIWVVAVSRTAADGADPVPRAWLDPETGISSDTWWENVITFPWKVVLSGQVSASPSFETGIVKPEFTLMAAEMS